MTIKNCPVYICILNCTEDLFIVKSYPAPINSINSLLNTEIGYILLTKKKNKKGIWKDVFQKKSFSKRTRVFRALTTEKNGSELNDPLSNWLMAWNSVSFWSLVKRS